MIFLRRLSIRLRITIGTLVIAALLAVAAVLVFRAQVEQILTSTTTTLLQHDASPYINEVPDIPSGGLDKPGRGQLVAVVDPSGTVLLSSLPGSLASQLHAITRLSDQPRSYMGGDELYRVLDQTIYTSAGDWHIVTARNEDSTTLSLNRITQALVWSAVIIVISFGVASWILTAVALRPVTRMRRQAEALVAQGSTEPLPMGPAIDELYGLAKTLNEFIVEVRQSVDRERQLVSDASHELRTPLAILMGQLELAHLSTGDAVALEAEITDAQQSVARLSALATGLLELSQLEQPGTAELTPGGSDWADLAGELATSVDSARILAAAGSVTIDYDIDQAGSKDRYHIAPTNFGRLVANLASNAIAAVPEDGWVRIALRHSRSMLVLTVVDSGPGMPASFIPIAFDRFSRPDESRAKNSGGAGLGLAIVHAIVTSAGGTISLANANGLTVTVELPAEQATERRPE